MAPVAQAEMFPRTTPVPDLHRYDVVILNTSAGKDSSATMAYVVDVARDQGYPLTQIVAVHADLGRAEWPGVAELAGRHAGHYGLRFEIVRRSQGDLLDRIRQRGRWPSPQQRYCTSELKTNQVYKLFTRVADDWRASNPDEAATRPIHILSCLGIRAAESPKRARQAPLEQDQRASNGRRHVDRWLPIHHWTEPEVWDRIHHAGLEVHWAYRKGMPRLSCAFCILASRSALMRAAQLAPELADEYVALEADMGHQFTASYSIAEVVIAARTRPEPVAAANWAG
jgi:3'-phosphoadenosine 5'-phosphosulfate sulfotransferase (PAPS reductase)/FAD synthetase